MTGRVVVGMSGGVDSCVAAALLHEQGYEVIGITMRLWTLEHPDAAPGRQHCCSVEDADDAREVAAALGFPYYLQNFEREFNARVVDYFVEEYQRGRTPNPCLACNEHIKFRSLLQRALALGADYLATGHYARRTEQDGFHSLRRALDVEKDQSYVLYTLGQAELARVLFPLGEYTKAEVRAIARRLQLPVADKPDSEEICFVPDNNYRNFLRERIEAPAGEMVDSSGQVIGSHEGIVDYTVGQRRGLGAFGDRRYVIELQPMQNRVVVGSQAELFSNSLIAERVHYVQGVAPSPGTPLEVKIRYKSVPSPAVIYPTPDGAELRFEQPQRAITPGQAVVFYDGDAVVGGGIIAHVNR
ncbi:MAG: tRNA 2-thiouridine(34) synthase MnmA [Dehalococcoidia bacterium]